MTKKKWLDGNLPHLIRYMPSNLRKESTFYEQANNEKIIIDHQSSKFGYVFGGGVIALGFITFAIGRGTLLGGLIVMIIIGLLFILYGATIGRRETVIDRTNGMYVFAGNLYGKPMPVPFVDTQGYWVSMGGASGAIGKQLKLKYSNKKQQKAAIGNVDLHLPSMQERWSFLVWYMDKNRPLPPGEAFDAYREADFERRKAAGFPPPLYLSTFPTPEATPAQQAEREKYWRDEDYYGTSESAWY